MVDRNFKVGSYTLFEVHMLLTEKGKKGSAKPTFSYMAVGIGYSGMGNVLHAASISTS